MHPPASYTERRRMFLSRRTPPHIPIRGCGYSLQDLRVPKYYSGFPKYCSGGSMYYADMYKFSIVLAANNTSKGQRQINRCINGLIANKGEMIILSLSKRAKYNPCFLRNFNFNKKYPLPVLHFCVNKLSLCRACIDIVGYLNTLCIPKRNKMDLYIY